MAKPDMYKKLKRTKETVAIKCDRFTVSGKPTCLSWFGDDLHPKEGCEFLGVRHFGTVHVCMALGFDLYHYEDNNQIIKPDEHCPIWEIK